MSHDLDRLQQLLREARPEPGADFVRDLERSLALRKPPRHERRRLRVLVAGSALAAGLTTLAIALGVAGVLPIGSSGEHAEAKENCTTVVIERVQRRPTLVVDGDGRYRIRYRAERVPRAVRRCR